MRKAEAAANGEQQPAPANRKRKLARRAGIVALTVVAAGYGAYFARDVGRDILHDPSAQEQAIERVIELAYDVDVWNVRCLGDEAMAGQRNPFAPWPRSSPNLGSVPYIPLAKADQPKLFLPFIRLNQNVCNNAAEFMQHPPQKPTEVDNNLLRALQTLAHEFWHFKQTHNEAQVDCEAMQTVGKLAIAMGASEKAARAAQERNTRFTKPNKPEAWLEDCYQGSLYDLQLGTDIYFPYGPPGTPDRHLSVRATP